jgi:hypothetical protein
VCSVERLRVGIVMRNASVENALRWMLAAWMLLATSVTSSTYVHGHSGGKTAHQHDGADCTLSRSFVPTTFHDGHDGDVSLSAMDVHRHGCLVLLGAITYQPMSGEPSDPHQKSPCDWDTIVAVSAAQGVRTLSKSLAVDHSGLAAPTVLAIGCVCEAKQTVFSCADIAPVSLLCDRARHERSGVLLA